MPSLRHQLLATLIPRLRRAGELSSLPEERERVLEGQARRAPGLATGLVPGFARRFTLVIDSSAGFDVHVLAPRGVEPERTLVWMHGGAYIAGIDPFHVRYAAALARRLGVRVVLPDYPLAPGSTWADSHDRLVDVVARACAHGPVLLGGDSAGGGIALAVAQSVRDRGLDPAGSLERLLLLSPWVDLTTSTPATRWFAARDPWLFESKLHAYADWWAGSPDDLARPEVSPALGDLSGLPPALVLCGTRDLLVPGVRLLARRAAEARWDLTYVEEPDLIHVYPILPLIPEARRARRTVEDFLRGSAR